MIAPIPFICLEGHECAKEKKNNKNSILSNMGDTLVVRVSQPIPRQVGYPTSNVSLN